MKNKTVVLVTGLALAAMFGSAVAAGSAPGDIGRAELTRAVVQKWSGHVDKTFPISSDVWAVEMAPAFGEATMEELQAAAGASTFEDMNSLLLGGVIGDGTQSLGDSNQDLVYVPVTPCRIIDTRVAGGAIAANTTRNFDITAVASYSFQGGDASNCNIGAAGSFAAAVINFTVVTPGADGYITAFPYLGTQPLASTLNYTAGSIVGNNGVARLDQGASADELSVYSFAQTHLVADVVGYFRGVTLPTIQCVNTANSSVAVPASGTDNVVAPVCAAGYTQTSTNCESSTWQMPFVFINGGTCSAQNNSASAATLRASRTCCRLQP